LHPELHWIGDHEIAGDELVLVVTREELVTIGNGINESLEAAEGGEYQTRVGATPEQARGLRARIRDVLQETHPPQT